MRFVIDRFEGDYAICESLDHKELHNIKKTDVPDGASEGNVITLREGVFVLDEEAKEQRAKEIKELMDTLWE